MKNILILLGGISSEHEISIKSSKSVYENIDKELFDISLCYISKDNTWYKFDADFNSLLENDWTKNHENDIIFNIIKCIFFGFIPSVFAKFIKLILIIN